MWSRIENLLLVTVTMWGYVYMCTVDLCNLATGSKSLGICYLGYGLCDIIVVYSLVRNLGNDYPQFGNLLQDCVNLV